MQIYNTKNGRFSYKLDVGRKGMHKYTCTSMSFRPSRFAKVTENVLVACGTATSFSQPTLHVKSCSRAYKYGEEKAMQVFFVARCFITAPSACYNTKSVQIVYVLQHH